MIRVYIAYTGRAVSTSTFFQGFTYYVSYGFRISLHGYVVSKSVFLWCIAQLVPQNRVLHPGYWSS